MLSLLMRVEAPPALEACEWKCVCLYVFPCQRHRPRRYTAGLWRGVGFMFRRRNVSCFLTVMVILSMPAPPPPSRCQALFDCECECVSVGVLPDGLHLLYSAINHISSAFLVLSKSKDRWSLFSLGYNFDFRQCPSSLRPLNGIPHDLLWLSFIEPFGTAFHRLVCIVFRYELHRIECTCGFLAWSEYGRERKRNVE